MLTRRELFGLLAGAIVLDPERLLWKPGAKLISIPKPATTVTSPLMSRLQVGDILTFEGHWQQFRITEVFPPSQREIAYLAALRIAPFDHPLRSSWQASISRGISRARLIRPATGTAVTGAAATP